MSTYTAFAIAPQVVTYGERRYAPAAMSLPSMNPAVTTYYYRATGGSRSAVRAPADLPSGAVVELVVMT